MPLDGAFLYCVRQELSDAVGAYIDKIHMPAKQEFVFALRLKGPAKKLLISLSPDAPRICFTKETFENPSAPPMFCMLLRKHLSSGRITAVRSANAERLIQFDITSTNEMGDRVSLQLICEFIGQKTNLILVGQDNRIIDAVRRSDLESGGRLVQPGAVYSLPEPTEKTDILEGDLQAAADIICHHTGIPLCDALLQTVGGISPLICRELAFRCTGSCDTPVDGTDVAALVDELSALRETLLQGGTPVLLQAPDGQPKDYSFMPIAQYGSARIAVSCASYAQLLEQFYGERQRIRYMDHQKSDLLKLIKNRIARNQKKWLLRKEELRQSADRERLRIYGELIKANIYRIERGATKAVVENYYDPDGKTVEIPLNTALSPAANAARYFKDYKKACTAEQTLGRLIESCAAEADYLQSVLFALESADTNAELNQIRAELSDLGYLGNRPRQKRQQSSAKPLEFKHNGFTILVGRNNLQNDILTLKTAAKADLWFHAKNIHGSHVILFTGGREPDDGTLRYAASLAAFYSKASNSNQVPVDYTPARYVKKPVGAKPGMVIYSTNKTLFVKPQNKAEDDV